MSNGYHVDESRPWFKEGSGWPGEVPKNAEFEEMTLGQMLSNAAERWPERKAIHFHTPTLDTSMTFRDLDRYVSAFATGLHQLGLKKGDVIALALPNSFQYVVAFYGANRIGCIPTGVNPTYQPLEVKHQLKLTGAKALICLDALYQSIVAPIVDDTDIDKIIVTNIADIGVSPIKQFLGKLLNKLPSGPTPAIAVKFKELLATEPRLPAVKIDPKEHPAAYLMTGGTTGVPKAAVLTHFNLVSNATQCSLWLPKAGLGTCMVGVLPLFHSFAMTVVMNLSIKLGGWMLLFPKPPEDYEDLFRAIVTLSTPEGMFLPGAEVLFQKMLTHPQIKDYDFTGKLTMCISGAGPLHDYVQQPFEEITKAKLVEGYGLTESSPVVSAGPLLGERMIGKIGLPLPGTDWCLVDPETGTNKVEEIGEKHPGEVWVAGPQIMKGYLNATEETAVEITEMDGKRWLHTGDIGYMDEFGRITICDRKKQLIKHRGYSVFPKDVESLLGMHIAISEVAVAGLPDPEGKVGEIIKAWVVLKDEVKDKVTTDDIFTWAKENITHYKVPAQIEFRNELPKTLVGKILRRELQEADPLFENKTKRS